MSPEASASRNFSFSAWWAGEGRSQWIIARGGHAQDGTQGEVRGALGRPEYRSGWPKEVRGADRTALHWHPANYVGPLLLQVMAIRLTRFSVPTTPRTQLEWIGNTRASHLTPADANCTPTDPDGHNPAPAPTFGIINQKPHTKREVLATARPKNKIAPFLSWLDLLGPPLTQ